MYCLVALHICLCVCNSFTFFNKYSCVMSSIQIIAFYISNLIPCSDQRSPLLDIVCSFRLFYTRVYIIFSLYKILIQITFLSLYSYLKNINLSS